MTTPSYSLVNNETGVIQSIGAIQELVRASGSLLLCDCAQAAGKIELPEADFIGVSGHKFGAPPGAGVLLVKDRGSLEPSGGQEGGYRRGTENLPAAAAMVSGFVTSRRTRSTPSSVMRSGFRAAAYTFRAPAASSSCANVKPIPRFAPVTNATEL